MTETWLWSLAPGAAGPCPTGRVRCPGTEVQWAVARAWPNRLCSLAGTLGGTDLAIWHPRPVETLRKIPVFHPISWLAFSRPEPHGSLERTPSTWALPLTCYVTSGEYLSGPLFPRPLNGDSNMYLPHRVDQRTNEEMDINVLCHHHPQPILTQCFWVEGTTPRSSLRIITHSADEATEAHSL